MGHLNNRVFVQDEFSSFLDNLSLIKFPSSLPPLQPHKFLVHIIIHKLNANHLYNKKKNHFIKSTGNINSSKKKLLMFLKFVHIHVPKQRN